MLKKRYRREEVSTEWNNGLKQKFNIKCLLLNCVLYFILRQWFLRALIKQMAVQTESISETTDKVVESANSQKQKFETISSNNKTLSALLDKLKTVSEDTVLMSKNTERQINQSINFSQKEHDFISANAEKMLVLRQKIQMIAELILELSEHSQQIGSTISSKHQSNVIIVWGFSFSPKLL